MGAVALRFAWQYAYRAGKKKKIDLYMTMNGSIDRLIVPAASFVSVSLYESSLATSEAW